MNYEFFVMEMSLYGSWRVIRRDIFKDGTSIEYINDILFDEESAKISADNSRERHYRWDHFEALKINRYMGCEYLVTECPTSPDPFCNYHLVRRDKDGDHFLGSWFMREDAQDAADALKRRQAKQIDLEAKHLD